MKKLGFGCMRLPLNDKKNSGDINLEKTIEMFDTFLQKGFTYFDTAYMYHDGCSEKIVKEALVKRHSRDSFLLADKMPVGMVEKDEDTARIFAHQLEKTGAGYYDYYLLHALDKNNFEKAEKFGVFEYLGKMKQEGKIKRLGFSFHDSAQVLDEILTERPEMEFVQLQINYLDWESERVQSRLCYETARKHGKDIIIMEPVKGGALANVPNVVSDMFKKEHEDWSSASWAVKYTAGLEGVIMVLSGMSDMQQLQDNMSYMSDFTPLNEKELSIVAKAGEIMSKSELIPCTACRYCVVGCPMNIAIPEYFMAYNKKLKGDEDYKEYFTETAAGKGEAQECIGCKKCEEACPQHIVITEKLSLMSDLL